MAIKERKQITGTEAQIKGYAGHNGVLAYATDTKHLHVLSGTAGITTELANRTDVPEISGKADKTYVDAELTKKQPKGDYATTNTVNAELAKKANETHTHPISQITDLQASLDAKTDDAALQAGLTAIRESIANVSSKVENTLGASTVHIVEAWSSTAGDSRYHKWSDGFIEQWGLLNGTGVAGGTITFPKIFSNTSYIFVAAPNDASASGSPFTWYTRKKATNSIASAIQSSSSSAPNQSWYAAGF